MLGQSDSLDEAELPDVLGNYSSDIGFEDGGNDSELRNPDVIVRTMPVNEDFGDNDRDNRYEY